MSKRILKFLFFLFFLVLAFYFAGYTQCTNCESNFPQGTYTTSSDTWTNITTCNWGGEYAYCSLNSSYIYQWMTCGDTDWDTQLTLYPSGTCGDEADQWNPGPFYLAYNDNACGYQSIVAYKPGYTSVRYLINKYNCNGHDSEGCMTVQWRRIPTTPSISATSTTICSGGSTTLSANNISSDDDYINVMWGTTSGGTEISADSYSVTVSPTATTTYYLRYFVKGGTATSFYSSSGIYSNVASITITVQSPPTAPTGISGTTTICSGNSTTLTATGGSAGSGCTYQWYAGGCGSGSVLGTGESITVSPTTATTYYVRRVGSTSCSNTTGCASTSITVNTLSTTPTSINAVVNP